MLIVFLDDLTRVRVPLHCFLVAAPGNKYILFIRVRVHRETKGGFAVGKGADNFTCLSIPEIYILIEAAGVELLAVFGEPNISDTHIVARVVPK